MPTRFILQSDTTSLYFTHPQEPDFCEWGTHPLQAHQWVDFDAATAGAYAWNQLHPDHEQAPLRVMQLVSGPHFHSVTLPGTPVLAGVGHG